MGDYGVDTVYALHSFVKQIISLHKRNKRMEGDDSQYANGDDDQYANGDDSQYANGDDSQYSNGDSGEEDVPDSTEEGYDSNDGTIYYSHSNHHSIFPLPSIT